jgi:hypothetical protein
MMARAQDDKAVLGMTALIGERNAEILRGAQDDGTVRGITALCAQDDGTVRSG